MYVLCTLAVLTLHSLLKSWNNKALESGRRSEGGGQRDRPEDGGVPEVWGASRSQRGGDDAVKVERRGARSCRAEGKRRQGGGGVRNVPDSRKRGQPVQRSSALLSPAVMFSTRKTWDLSHAPCLQELWKKDISLDASSVDFLMSDGEDDGSFLSLPTAAFSQCPSLSAELTETNTPSQQLLIQSVLSIRNLLGENPTDKLDIKMNPDGSGQLYVPGLTEITVQSPEDINRVFELGHMNRATACTNLNEHSSRSHALLIITVSGFNTATGNRTQGKLNLVDLAGSERIGKSGAEGSRLREAQCINKSLSALGDVINALRSKHSHVPFRNSRLTYLLQDSLNGDSKTLMMVQVSPLAANMSESVCSLKFAQRVRSVELSSSSSSSRRHENSSTSSSPTHDSVELDSPPVTPVPLPISRASSAGSTLSSASRTPSSSRRRSQSQLSTDRQVDRASPLVGDGGQDD
uniref:kinesin-like protein KIFC3 n=1 Tax=Epinephelus lanceolatus TaxID=310571 RepID=UPI0014484083|nr:kinesin-like protein KIFC3 [Epinephelus lanceolatus]